MEGNFNTLSRRKTRTPKKMIRKSHCKYNLPMPCFNGDCKVCQDILFRNNPSDNQSMEEPTTSTTTSYLPWSPPSPDILPPWSLSDEEVEEQRLELLQPAPWASPSVLAPWNTPATQDRSSGLESDEVLSYSPPQYPSSRNDNTPITHMYIPNYEDAATLYSETGEAAFLTYQKQNEAVDLSASEYNQAGPSSAFHEYDQAATAGGSSSTFSEYDQVAVAGESSSTSGYDYSSIYTPSTPTQASIVPTTLHRKKMKGKKTHLQKLHEHGNLTSRILQPTSHAQGNLTTRLLRPTAALGLGETHKFTLEPRKGGVFSSIYYHPEN
ncbi:hypothetical protein MrNuV_ORF098 [Macrobrachium rosenbergii nudivirus]|nr:hypothetical protein MrNuV_ORF098 [Macrobrachium rosenbergii nudivirus]